MRGIGGLSRKSKGLRQKPCSWSQRGNSLAFALAWGQAACVILFGLAATPVSAALRRCAPADCSSRLAQPPLLGSRCHTPPSPAAAPGSDCRGGAGQNRACPILHASGWRRSCPGRELHPSAASRRAAAPVEQSQRRRGGAGGKAFAASRLIEFAPAGPAALTQGQKKPPGHTSRGPVGQGWGVTARKLSGSRPRAGQCP